MTEVSFLASQSHARNTSPVESPSSDQHRVDLNIKQTQIDDTISLLETQLIEWLELILPDEGDAFKQEIGNRLHALADDLMNDVPSCGFEFPPPERETHGDRASNEGILSGEVVDTEYDVEEISYSVHTKRGAGEDDPKTLRVDYRVGFNDYQSEWVCPEHDGWARKKFEKWWAERSNDPVPDSAELAARIGKAGGLAEAKTVLVRKVGGENLCRLESQTRRKNGRIR